jgi:hypothetical protein
MDVPNRELISDLEDVLSEWFPRLTQVHRFFDCYTGRSDRVISSVYEDGRVDLCYLNPPTGLSEAHFNQFVAGRLQELSLVALIDASSTKALDLEGGIHLLIDAGVAVEADASEKWSTITAWLLKFFPTRYRSKQTYSGPAFERSQLI